ncbi:MAG: hypothetical protein H0T54_08585 [Geodermatophilaceae bacterium]|nr:hypothetical protein [Geodermatophilaceae bacterium]
MHGRLRRATIAEPEGYTVRAEAVATARALVQTDIDAMLAEVTRELGRSQTFLCPDSTPIVPGGGLQHQEDNGGHTILRHLGRTHDDLSARANQPNPPPAASSWTNREVAESTVAATIARNESEFQDWLSNPAQKPTLDLFHSGTTITGRSVEAGSTTAIDVTGATVRLLRSQNGPGAELGYIILSSFPSP